MVLLPLDVHPPWYILLPAYTYIFLSAGIIALGRMESNKDARLFVQMLKDRSEEIRKMN
jgi:hypothetical protein